MFRGSIKGRKTGGDMESIGDKENAYEVLAA
jgi:hypothetical protein